MWTSLGGTTPCEIGRTRFGAGAGVPGSDKRTVEESGMEELSETLASETSLGEFV